MLSDDISAADGMDAEFLLFTLCTLGLAFIDILQLTAQCVIHCIGDHQCRAGRSIEFFVVMFLDKLDIKVRIKLGSCLFYKIDKHIDAQGHISRIENTDFLGQCF